jgi:hypothetical protein
MKYTAKRGRLRAYDRDFPNAYQQLRGFSFSKHTIYEVAALMEYNFYPIGMEKSGKYKFTPYINLGGAIMYCNRISRKFQFVIPFGVGVKYRFTPKIELGIEWVFRRTFTDKLDGLPIYYEMADAIYGNKQRGFASNRDWYSFLGVTLHYCLRKTGFKCPAYNDIR